MCSSDDEQNEDEQQGSKQPYTIVALSLFLLSWQAKFRVPDNCIAALLAFLHHFLLFISAILFSAQLSSFASNIPRSVEQLRLILGVEVDTFSRLVVCSLCHSVYEHDACLINVSRTRE